MRHDIFIDKKSIHIKLSKDIHTALRERLLKAGITMQDLFQDAAELILTDSPRAQKTLDNISRKKMKRYLEGGNKKQTRALGELDTETLYSLLEQDDKREADEE